MKISRSRALKSTGFYCVIMQSESDPNIVYGGDPEEECDIDPSCPSLGHLMLNDFKLGENNRVFVSCKTDFD